MAFIGFAVVGFGVTFLSMFMSGLGLMGGKQRAHDDSYYVKRAYLVSAAASVFLGLICAGGFGGIGAVVGALATWAFLGRSL